MTDTTQLADTYKSVLNRIQVDNNGNKINTYFGWGIELQYDEASANIQLVNTRFKDVTHAVITPDGTITLNPIPSAEEILVMQNDVDQARLFKDVRYSYFLYMSLQAFEQFIRTMGLSDRQINLRRDKGSNTFIWTAADEVTAIKERKCTTCHGFRKVSGNCHSKTFKGCTQYDCPEAIAIVTEAKNRNPYIRVLPPSVIAHDHVHVCAHGLTSSHETKFAQQCWACSGSGKKIAGGNPRFRKWTGNNSIVINPDFSYAVAPSDVYPEYHTTCWNGDFS